MKSKTLLIISAVLSFVIFNNFIPHNLTPVKNKFNDVITFCAVGDLMCHTPQMDYALTDKNGFNFDFCFYKVKPIIEKADIAIANFETTLSGKEKKYSGYPAFNSPDAFLDAVKNAGFDFLFTSNNHSYDRGKEGIVRTVTKISNAGLKSTGTFSSKKGRDSIKIVEVKNFKIGFLAYTEHLNGFRIPQENDFLVNLIDTNRIKRDIKNLKQKEIDLVVVYFHFGNENQRQPSKYQKDIVKRAVSYGADIILASHPHVLQKLETFKPVNSKLDTGFVAYSLGNFISNQRWRYSDAGVILNFSLQRNSAASISLKNIEIIPTWVFKGQVLLSSRFVILPAQEAFAEKPLFFLTQDNIKKMKQSYSDTGEIMPGGLKLDKSKLIFNNFSSR
jgi:poly-gamma-glutamate capsule biosynthesis protein CapA/YwtB (metallophosphatase superfamily)